MQPLERIAGRILVIRGRKVILDADLADLYGVARRVLLQAVRRNAERYPPDFLLRLTNHEVAVLRSQSVISKHGAIMAATVLNPPRATEMSVFVVRAFVKMRQALTANKEIAQRLDDLERKVVTHDQAIGEIILALRQLTQPSEPQKRRGIGLVRDA